MCFLSEMGITLGNAIRKVLAARTASQPVSPLFSPLASGPSGTPHFWVGSPKCTFVLLWGHMWKKFHLSSNDPRMRMIIRDQWTDWLPMESICVGEAILSDHDPTPKDWFVYSFSVGLTAFRRAKKPIDVGCAVSICHRILSEQSRAIRTEIIELDVHLHVSSCVELFPTLSNRRAESSSIG